MIIKIERNPEKVGGTFEHVRIGPRTWVFFRPDQFPKNPNQAQSRRGGGGTKTRTDYGNKPNDWPCWQSPEFLKQRGD